MSQRIQVKVNLLEELVAQIDERRGQNSRSSEVEATLMRAYGLATESPIARASAATDHTDYIEHGGYRWANMDDVVIRDRALADWAQQGPLEPPDPFPFSASQSNEPAAILAHVEAMTLEALWSWIDQWREFVVQHG